jgi:hypothetical protein
VCVGIPELVLLQLAGTAIRKLQPVDVPLSAQSTVSASESLRRGLDRTQGRLCPRLMFLNYWNIPLERNRLWEIHFKDSGQLDVSSLNEILHKVKALEKA